MGLRISFLSLILPAVLGSTRLLAADAPAPSFAKDLTATIVLQGMPCNKVVDAKRNGDSDYTAQCKDGNRYHVYVNEQGRVIVKKL